MDTTSTIDFAVLTYGAYLSISVGMTIWVAQTLSKSGELFLVDVFGGNKELAKAVNHLLVVGFYLVNLGYVCLTMKLGYNVLMIRDSVEALSQKIGVVLLVLGGMHFMNMLIFKYIRSGNCANNPNPPVLPDGYTTIGGN